MLHAVVILVHAAYHILSGRSYTFANDFADLLVLALRSRGTEVLGATGVRTGNHGSWSKVTRVVEQEGGQDGDPSSGTTGLEIVIDEGGTRDEEKMQGESSDDDGDVVEMDDLRRRRRRGSSGNGDGG